ncbi:class I adenylate-forming enzyme family protein [Paraburkholderia strydomiana]|uniref:class I adenylate-forming enzyme family protein n=1 Tax=Paraburkholderia strydomiana TaxID=1245417 RepID=UPI00286331BE|nr:long-chain-fatty-acid--CoA ligase [Paraburkholderia strydomiana]MDR7005059.1 fatty-acyl-CoA synthase [Paraburkholderia strydomiana]
MLTITSLFENTVAKYPDRLALVCGNSRFTYAQWDEHVRGLAQALFDLGVRQTDRVAIFQKTSDATATAYLACQLLGAIAVPMNYRLSANEAIFIIRDAGARALIYDHSMQPVVAKIEQGLPDLRIYVRVAGHGNHTDEPDRNDAPSYHRDFDALIDSTRHRDAPLPTLTPDDISALVYTSGTTGRPKGAIHTHANDVAIATNCVMEYSLTSTDSALHIAPLYHVGGMQAYFMPHLMVGAANIVLPRYDPARTLAAIAQYDITTLFAVPTQIQDMLFHPAFTQSDHSSLRMITTGGAAIPAAAMQRVIDEFCPNVYNGYGMTEASLTLLLHPRDALARLGSCGKPTLISTCRVVTNDPARAVPSTEGVVPGEVGQLIVRGPQLARAYWNNPVETARKFRDGWLYTGDLFSVDEGGYFHFHGRADDMIVSGGENIYPREVEEVLYHCPGVQEAAVIGVPDAKWGQAVTAFVVRSDAQLTEDAIIAFCKASDDLAPYKRPKKVLFVERLPLNPSGKVLRRELAASVHENLLQTGT